MRTLGAFDARLFADAANPFVGARGGIAGLAGLPALEPPRIHILTTAEQRTEQRDLRVGRRMPIHQDPEGVHNRCTRSYRYPVGHSPTACCPDRPHRLGAEGAFSRTRPVCRATGLG